MQTNDHKIRNYSEVLSQEYGEHGTPERERFQEEAYAFYSGQIIQKARKQLRMTQTELADSIGADKAYISRIEKGVTIPSAATFFRLVGAMGLTVTLVERESLPVCYEM